jgi:hypothetical protein
MALGFLFCAVVPASGGTAVVLADAELERIDAGASVGDDRPSSTGTMVMASSEQTIAGAAQQGASALILVNAVSSTVSAQVNVIVNTGAISHANQANAGTPTR